MEITTEIYEKVAYLLKQKSPPKISDLEILNAILRVLENGSKWYLWEETDIRFTHV